MNGFNRFLNARVCNEELSLRCIKIQYRAIISRSLEFIIIVILCKRLTEITDRILLSNDLIQYFPEIEIIALKKIDGFTIRL